MSIENLSTDKAALISALECSLCLNMFCEPISVSCGHTFCRSCLVKSLSRHKKKCPTCREVCHISAENAAENITIKSIALIIDPALYESRLLELQAEKNSWNTVFPIFYYNAAMFPGSKLSLHLFEPRYKTMMQRIVNTSRRFAFVPNFGSYCASVGDIALVAELKEVEFLADGRCLLEAVLATRHRIVDHFVEDGTQGLHFCQLERYDDIAVTDTTSLASIHSLQEEATLLLRCVVTEDNRRSMETQFGPVPNGAEPFSLWLAAVSPLSAQSQYSLLVSRNTAHRLEQCVAALKDWAARVSRREALLSSATAIASNAANLTASGFAALSSFFTTVVTPAGGAAASDPDRGSPAGDDFFGGDSAQSSDSEAYHSGDDGAAGTRDDFESQGEEEMGEFLSVEFLREPSAAAILDSEDTSGLEEIEFTAMSLGVGATSHQLEEESVSVAGMRDARSEAAALNDSLPEYADVQLHHTLDDES